jgi:hypothetical protein
MALPVIRKLIAAGSVAAANVVFGWASQHHEKERRKNIEYKMATLDISPEEVMECYIASMQQPAWYDDDF